MRKKLLSLKEISNLLNFKNVSKMIEPYYKDSSSLYQLMNRNPIKYEIIVSGIVIKTLNLDIEEILKNKDFIELGQFCAKYNINIDDLENLKEIKERALKKELLK